MNDDYTVLLPTHGQNTARGILFMKERFTSIPLESLYSRCAATNWCYWQTKRFQVLSETEKREALELGSSLRG